MPPTAWALASMWSAVWDAPRFQGHDVALRREALAPLLKIAASCVAALLPHVAGGDRNSRLPPYGASRELLVAALDGSPEGAALSNPTGDPEGFVRALTKASFMTGDGTFINGVSEEQLEQLLSERCAPQLAQAALLVQDPSGALQGALEAASSNIQELIAWPPAAGNLQAVADRLLLAQRLEHLAEEARELLAAPAEEEVVDVELDAVPAGDSAAAAEAPECTMEDVARSARESATMEDSVMDEQVETSAEDSAAAAEAPEFTMEDVARSARESATMEEGAVKGQVEEEPLQRAKTVVSGSTSPSPAGATPSSPAQEADQEKSELSRTRSQIAASVKVQKVKKHLDESLQAVHDLRRTASHLARKGAPPDGEFQALEAELEAIDQARRRARNFGEDLVEDMLALDGLSKLAPEDRSTRKAAIAGIESLLQDVDAAKERLNSLHQSLQAKLEAAQAAREAEAQKEGEATAAAASPVPGRRSTAAGLPPEKRAAVDALSSEAPPPRKEKWREVRLPLRFHSREELDHYTILASVPGLDTEELKLELSEDETTLTVQGLRVPTPQEAARMQQKISSKLRTLAERAPQRFARLRNDIAQIAQEAYLELGQDEYGRFSETFRVPDDVDVGAINASYRDGVLRIVLPRVVPAAPHFLYDGGRGGRYASGRHGYPAARAFTGFADGPPPGRAPPLFGGLDDRYLWG